MSKILVIDDDTRLRTLLGKFLEENSFQINLAKDTIEAKQKLKSDEFDLLIVDVMMPNQNGIEFAKEFRQENKTPMIMLTARGEFEDRIQGLEAGADDYLQKPFEPKELLLRINNILKRVGTSKIKTNDSNTINFGNFTFNLDNKRLKQNKEFIHLTNSEEKILYLLCSNKSTPQSRENLSQICGGIDKRSIDVQITRLRKKLEENPKKPKFLKTVRNQGYVILG
ncbi:MAG: response regulator [Rickettsiales bacterium]|nr:response regulator [Rickettsiales bacterium]